MMLDKMPRATFNAVYDYDLIRVLQDDCPYHHCGNCSHYGLNTDDVWQWSGYRVCGLIIQCGNSFADSAVNQRRGLCRLWQTVEKK